jgi:hypothetical protein
MRGTCRKHWRDEECTIYNILVGKPARKRLLGRPRRRWEDNTGMDRREIGWERVDRMHVAQDRDR